MDENQCNEFRPCVQSRFAPVWRPLDPIFLRHLRPNLHTPVLLYDQIEHIQWVWCGRSNSARQEGGKKLIFVCTYVQVTQQVGISYGIYWFTYNNNNAYTLDFKLLDLIIVFSTFCVLHTYSLWRKNNNHATTIMQFKKNPNRT